MTCAVPRERSIPEVRLVALWRFTKNKPTAPPFPCGGCIDAEAVPASARTLPDEPSEDMDHVTVLRDKIARFREEIADIQELNARFPPASRIGTVAQVAHARRQARLQAIQHELIQLIDFGRNVVSAEKINENPLPGSNPSRGHEWRRL